MRLAKLTLNGFKSFADRTEFTFDDAITGIVGPNGCGKSNVVDAIKWVLGERSSKSLRGKEMIDVIFAGSAGRKPSGLASVTLSFENPVVESAPEPAGLRAPTEAGRGQSEGEYGEAEAGLEEVSEVEFVRDATHQRALPIDADMVEVERRLYRDGTSQYLINGRRARLRDIRDLFLDTGIGADAYSIIEQGKVDAMLLASPMERRTIFEEAAGIAKYKQRRIESQRKLERAQANLAVTREQLASTERRLRIARGQAAKARRFKELDGELRAWRMALAFDQYDEVRQRLDGLTSGLSKLEGVRREAAETLSALEQAKQEAEVSRHEQFTEHKGLEEQRLAALHAEQSGTQRRQMTERALADARVQVETDEARLVDLDARLHEVQRADDATSQLIAAVAEKLGEADRQLAGAAEERARILEELAAAQAALGERRAAATDIERQLATLSASIEAGRQRAEAIGQELARLAEKGAALIGERGRLEEAEATADSAVSTRQERITGIERDLASTEDAAASLSRDRRELAERVMTLEQQHLRLDGRRQTLREMVESRVGLGEAVRDVLARRDSGSGFQSVLAPVADLIDVDAELAPAVEAALGEGLQSLVVESLAAMPTAEELGTLAGRVTFLPMAGLERESERLARGRMNDDYPSATLRDLLTSARVVPVRGAVRVRPAGGRQDATEALVDRLLGGTYLVQDLDSALILAAAAPGARFVTRDGSVLERDGRISAGPATGGGEEAPGVLQRRSELLSLESEVTRLGSALQTERDQLASVDAEAAGLNTRQADLRSRLAGEQRALIGEQTRLEQARAERSRLERDLREIEEERREQANRLARVEEERKGLGERASRLARLRDDELAAARAADQAIGQIQARAEAAGDQVTAAKVESGRLSEQLAGARREHRRLADAAAQIEGERRDLVRLVEQSRSRLAEHERAIEEARVQIARAGEDARRLQVEVAAAAMQLQEAGDRLRELAERVQAARQHAQHVERDWHSLEVSRRELEVKREGLEERASEELMLDLSFEYSDYRAMMAGGGVSRVDQAGAAAEVDRLRDEIRRLGSVNLEAIEEEAQLVQRNEELIRQVADIDDAAKKLCELIDRLNLASRERFGEVFGRIQEHFAGQEGMFRKLFGGGRAEIRLMPLIKEVDGQRVETDQVDLLESGIEIIAKPPGKEPRSISQLSGGEKTLTAVALLLAIFKSKPSCFCVLDEVDAALDDANVGRYCAVVREFTTHSHFIVITHNKKTMQNADRLYGVTMQERGVSTRVSVRFEQVGQDGHLDHHENGSKESAEASSPAGGARRLRRALASMREPVADPAEN